MQQKHSAWVALGVICFSLSVANYLNSRQARTQRFDYPLYAESIKSLDSLEDTIYKQINNHRVNKGLPPLALDPELTKQARLYSQLMASNQIPFSKEGLKQLNSPVGTSTPHRGFSTLISNCRGYVNPAQATVDAWLGDNQDNTLASVEGQYEVTGVGVAKNSAGRYYFTQILLHR